jgi:hypothetical protein
MNSLEREEFLRKEAEELENVNFGNLIQCNFGEHGEIIGFNIR